MRRNLLLVSGVVISICSILFVFLFTNFSSNVKALLSVNFYFLLLAICFQFASFALWAIRIKILVQLFGREISFREAYKAVLISVFYSAITPSSSGGEPMRIQVIQDSIKSYGVASAVVLTERAVDFILLTSFIPILVTLGVIRGDLGVLVSLSAIGILLVICIGLYLIINRSEALQRFLYKVLSKFLKKPNLREKIESELRNLRESLLNISHVSKCKIIIIFLITMVSWLLGFFSLPIVALSLGCSLPLSYAISFQVALVLLSTLFFTPGGSGLIEFGSAYALSNYITFDKLGAVVFVWRFVTYYVPMFVGSTINILYLKKK